MQTIALKLNHRRDLIETLVNKLFKITILFLLITSCSLDDKSGIWTDDKKSKLIKDNNTRILQEKKKQTKEFNLDVQIFLENQMVQEISLVNTNNIKIGKDLGKLTKTSKYNFSKIKRFDEFNPELIFVKEDIFFFDNKGTVLKFNKNLKSIWKKNNYSKIEKKFKPILYMTNFNNKLIVADTVSKLYAVNVDDGEILWSKYSEAPFNSQPKAYNNKIFVLDLLNQLNCYSASNGEKIWSVNTEKSFINTDGNQSIAIKDNKVFFNNSLGDITAIDADTGVLIWQISTENSILFDDIIKLKTSALIATYNSILFSNNKNEFYSIDQESGKINWKQEINSSLTPILIGNLIVTVSPEGYLFYIDHNTGNIVKIINVLDQLSNKLKNNANPIGFTMTYKNLYLSMSNGRLIIFDIKNDKIESISKFDNSKISRPFIFDQNIFIAKDNSVIKIN